MAAHILIDISVPFSPSHMMTLNLISFHKQLTVDTVHVVALSPQQSFIHCAKLLSILSLFFLDRYSYKKKKPLMLAHRRINLVFVIFSEEGFILRERTGGSER